MADEPDSIVLRYLRRMDEAIAAMRHDITEIKERLGILAIQYASLSRRLDRLGSDVELIKRRLDLVDAQS